MPDPRFFTPPDPIDLVSLIENIPAAGLELGDDKFSKTVIDHVAPLAQAGPGAVSFLDNIKYKDDFVSTKAGACVVHPDFASLAPAGVALLLSTAPYKSYALIAQYLYSHGLESAKTSLSAQAMIDPNAIIGNNVVIEAGAVIKKGAEIGENCRVEANAVVDENVVIGASCRIGAGAVISHALIGAHVRIYPGVKIGQDGFGFAMDPTGFVKVPQLGRVIVEDSVEIGANTTIDRGAGPDTVIGEGSWIDNLVQIGHNVRVGRCCVIVSQCGISGSSVLEDFSVLGGQVGVAGHLTIGKGSRIAAQSGIMRDVPQGSEYMGYPAVPIKTFMKQVALLKKMVKNR